MTPYSRPHEPSGYQHFWDDPNWRATQVKNLVMRGISARRADEIIQKQIKHYRERGAVEDAKDEAYDARS